MKRYLYLLLFVLLISGCNTTPYINAEGLSGIGKLQIGQTKREAKKVLSHIVKYSPYITGYGDADEDTPYITGCTGEYEVLPGEVLTVNCTFYKDSLVVITLGKYDGVEIVREALNAKYGAGHITGTKNDFLETWRGEDVKAIYQYQTDNNPNYYKRKTLERLDFSPTNRNVFLEMIEYAEPIRKAKEKERSNTISSIL